MKAALISGILLVILGIVGFATGGLTYTHDKKVIDAQPLQLEHRQKEKLPIPPALSTIALLGGIALLAIGLNRNHA